VMVAAHAEPGEENIGAKDRKNNSGMYIAFNLDIVPPAERKWLKKRVTFPTRAKPEGVYHLYYASVEGWIHIRMHIDPRIFSRMTRQTRIGRAGAKKTPARKTPAGDMVMRSKGSPD